MRPCTLGATPRVSAPSSEPRSIVARLDDYVAEIMEAARAELDDTGEERRVALVDRSPPRRLREIGGKCGRRRPKRLPAGIAEPPRRPQWRKRKIASDLRHQPRVRPEGGFRVRSTSKSNTHLSYGHKVAPCLLRARSNRAAPTATCSHVATVPDRTPGEPDSGVPRTAQARSGGHRTPLGRGGCPRCG